MRLTEAFDLFGLARVGEISQSTLTWYVDRFNIFLDIHKKNSRVRDVSLHDLRLYRLRLYNQGLSEFTIHGYLRAVKKLFGFLVDEGVLEEDPSLEIELPDLPEELDPKAVSEADKERILEAARNNTRNYALVRFLIVTGARVGGLVKLRLQDVDIKAGEAIVREKKKRIRTVYFEKETARALQHYLWDRPRVDSPSFFLTLIRPYRGISRSGIQTLLKRLGKRAGCTGPHSPHAFRHRYARELLKGGVSLEKVSNLLGHRDIETTERYYARWAKDELKQVYRQHAPV